MLKPMVIGCFANYFAIMCMLFGIKLFRVNYLCETEDFILIWFKIYIIK